MNRDALLHDGTFDSEGSSSTVSMTRTLWNLGVKWGGGVNFTHRFGIDRRFLGTELRPVWCPLGQDCQIVDRATGEPIPLDPVTGSFERSDGSGDWSGDSRFDPGSGDLEITCSEGEGSVLVGPAPRFGSFVIGMVATIVVPIVLFLAGVAVLLVTGILWSVRPAQPR